MSNQERLNAIVERLREQGGRITPQRVAILEILIDDRSHPTIEDVYRRVAEQFPTTSVATVYKTVGLLKEMGEVFEIGLPSEASRYDGTSAIPHPHLICARCGRVVDLPASAAPSDGLQDMARGAGFELTAGRVDYWGLCADCRNED